MNCPLKLLFLCLLLCISCGANQSQRSSSRAITATHLDVDINGTVTLVDQRRNTVSLMSKEQSVLSEIGGSGWDNDQFDHPQGVWARNGIDIFVADYGNHRIQRFDRKLAFIASFSTRERANPDERFGYPTDVALSRLGDLFICDSENSRILKIVGLSKVEKSFGGFDAGKGRLRKPNQIEIGPNDNVYVQDGERIIAFDAFGNYIRQIGEGMFHDPPLLFADEYSVVALSKNTLHVFDKDDRLQQTISLEQLIPKEHIRSFVLSRGTLYLLTDGGIRTAPDPRQGF